MACGLCERDSTLCKSHVFPEFLCRRMYDNQRQALVFSGDGSGKRTVQSGVTVPLLCRDCETHIGVYEKHFADWWYQRSPVPECIDGSTLEIRTADYAKLKLFVLSLVWRASIAKHAHFESADLGRVHEERMRKMILSGDPGSTLDYPILGGLIVDGDSRELWDKVLLMPVRFRLADRLWAHRMVFGGVAWTVVTSSQSMERFNEFCLTDQGAMTMTVTTLDEFVQATGLLETARRVTGAPPS